VTLITHGKQTSALFDPSEMHSERAASNSVTHLLSKQIRFGTSPANEHREQLALLSQLLSAARIGTQLPSELHTPLFLSKYELLSSSDKPANP
jgi:hypothetical protein